MQIIYGLIAVFATFIGSISGIGGGIIIKPVMDAVSGLPISTINFMSGCTVLSMSLFTFFRRRNDGTPMNYPITVSLAAGACIGGVLGKMWFSAFKGDMAFVQAFLLLLVNLGVLFYLFAKKHIKTLKVENLFASVLIGFCLGTVSSFLGIGGGPINIAVLSFFFSLSPKATAKNSLFIILCSQGTNLFTTFVTNKVPSFELFPLLLMMACGIGGAYIGGRVNKKMSEDGVEKFFLCVLFGLIALNIFNMFKV